MKTSLYNKHIELNAKMIDFAGYQMPINYPEGISKECQSIRTNVGVFDVSHMGQILIDGDKFLTNLRTNNLEKHETCKKCFGEPTKRGAIIRNIWNSFPTRTKKVFSFLNLTKKIDRQVGDN